MTHTLEEEEEEDVQCTVYAQLNPTLTEFSHNIEYQKASTSRDSHTSYSLEL